MPRGTDLYEQAVKANAPIRILYESGKSYITQNQDKAIELGLMPSRKTKAAKPTKSKKSKTSKVKKSETNVSTDVQVDAEGFLIGSWNPA